MLLNFLKGSGLRMRVYIFSLFDIFVYILASGVINAFFSPFLVFFHELLWGLGFIVIGKEINYVVPS